MYLQFLKFFIVSQLLAVLEPQFLLLCHPSVTVIIV